MPLRFAEFARGSDAMKGVKAIVGLPLMVECSCNLAQ